MNILKLYPCLSEEEKKTLFALLQKENRNNREILNELTGREWVFNVDASVRLLNVIKSNFADTKIKDITNVDLRKHTGKKSLAEFNELRGF